MPLNIKDVDTHNLAREVANMTGESLTAAVKHALQDKLKILVRKRKHNCLADELDQIALHCAGLQLNDQRSSEEILGYDENGLAT